MSFYTGGAAFSSASDDWPTPQDFYDRMNVEFGFILDVRASNTDRKAPPTTTAATTPTQPAVTDATSAGPPRPGVWEGPSE